MKKSMQRGITITEIVIILGLLAVVVLVAIPHLGSGRQAADEASIATAMVAYANAQEVFRSRNLSEKVVGSTHQREYCSDFALLGGTRGTAVDGGPLNLIDAAMANATPEAPYCGYYFTNDPHVSDWSHRYGLYARPVHYGKPAYVAFYITTSRKVWMKDLGSSQELLPLDSSWTSR